MKRSPEKTRNKLIQAAIDIIATVGAAHFTLDAVAHEAQVSKGGLLHHFPTKESLLFGIVEAAKQSWLDRVTEETALEPEGSPGRWCRVYIRTTFEPTEEEVRIFSLIFSIALVYPNLIKGDEDDLWWLNNDDGLPAGRSLLIQLACDAFWQIQITGIPHITKEKADALRAELEQLAK